MAQLVGARLSEKANREAMTATSVFNDYDA